MNQDMQEDFSLTPTAFLILDAVLAGKSVYHRRTEADSLDRRLYGEFKTVSRNLAGAAASRAVQSLQARGFLTERDADGRGKEAVVYEPFDRRLTSRGCRALIQKLQGRGFDPSDPRVDQAFAKFQERQEFEAERDERKAQDRLELTARMERVAQAERKTRVAAARVVLVKFGLAEFSESLDDDGVNAFRIAMGDAEHCDPNELFARFAALEAA